MPWDELIALNPLLRNDAHKIIEECMILANIAAANFMEKHKEPALYRIHAAPSEEKLTSFRAFLSECGLSLEGGMKPTTKDYAKLLEQSERSSGSRTHSNHVAPFIMPGRFIMRIISATLVWR